MGVVRVRVFNLEVVLNNTFLGTKLLVSKFRSLYSGSRGLMACGT